MFYIIWLSGTEKQNNYSLKILKKNWINTQNILFFKYKRNNEST